MIREAIAFSLGVVWEALCTGAKKASDKVWAWAYELRDWIEGTYW